MTERVDEKGKGHRCHAYKQHYNITQLLTDTQRDSLLGQVERVKIRHFIDGFIHLQFYSAHI